MKGQLKSTISYFMGSLSWTSLLVSSLREHMATYTIPTGLILVEEMPRNQMGKVNKKDLLRKFFPTRSDWTMSALRSVFREMGVLTTDSRTVSGSHLWKKGDCDVSSLNSRCQREWWDVSTMQSTVLFLIYLIFVVLYLADNRWKKNVCNLYLK